MQCHKYESNTEYRQGIWRQVPIIGHAEENNEDAILFMHVLCEILQHCCILTLKAYGG